MAVAATFLASALFHEWILPTVYFDYPDTHGPTMLFFAWQFLLVAGEFQIGHWVAAAGIGKVLPRWCRTALIISLGLPVAHLFTDSYVNSDFFRQMTVFLPCILPERSSNTPNAPAIDHAN